MFLKEIQKYTGQQIHQRFAYRYFKKQCNPIGDLLIFRGPMEVLADQMIDLEDSLAEDFIWSNDALNILWELPILGNNAFGAVAYQRLFNTQIAQILAQPALLNRKVTVMGDDLMIPLDNNEYGKCSVSITHVTKQVALGHTGLNIHAGNKAPDHAFSLALTDSQISTLAENIIKMFYDMNRSLFTATTKLTT